MTNQGLGKWLALRKNSFLFPKTNVRFFLEVKIVLVIILISFNMNIYKNVNGILYRLIFRKRVYRNGSWIEAKKGGYLAFWVQANKS